MSGTAGRSKTRFAVLVLLLLGAMPLFAQEAAGPPSHSDNALTVLKWVCVGVGALLSASYGVSKARSNKMRQGKLPREETAIEPPKAAPVREPAETSGTSRSTKSIFISYRRQDSQHITGRIYDRLSAQFGKNAVFKDVDSMPLGVDFRAHIREQVNRCSVVIAVIGKNWNGASSGMQRLNDQRDHLRIEIETALECGIPVIPVLVDGVEMPAEEELPKSLAQLAYHNGIAIRPDPDFHHDADRLLRGIEPLLK